MNNAEARRLLREAMAPYRERSYADLQRLMKESESHEIEGASGARYAIRIHAFWDDRALGNLRVMGAIDDGGWRAFAPLCDDFIVAPDGSFVGEPTAGDLRATARMATFILGGGLAGLGTWCALDWLQAKSPAGQSPDGYDLIWMFPIALLPIALFHFREATAGRRILLSVAGTLLATIAAAGLALVAGSLFHSWIRGRL